MAPWEEIHDRLLDQALDLARRLEHLEGELEHRKRLGSDVAQSSRAASPVLAELIQATSQELTQLRRTLHRIAAQRYGVCSACGASVPDERLRVDPHTLYCDGCAPQRRAGALDRLRSQHVGLRVLLGSIGQLVAELADPARGAAAKGGTLAATVTLLGDLERELARHFRLEEEGGYLAEVLSVAPRHSRRASTLAREHERFRKDVAVILERARQAGPSSPEWETIDAQLREFSEALLAHEEAENEIIADAWLDDHGGG
jgi:RNA polymerase-binding transcription factor DksA